MDLQIELHRDGVFSPLRYPGGKACLSSFLGKIIKQDECHQGTYVEPYAGGAGAALGLLLSEQIHDIVINDLDPAVYAFWSSVVSNPGAFIEIVRRTPVSIREWRSQREIYKNPESASALELGFATFFLNRTNRSGIIEGWPIGGIDQCGPWKIDARYNKTALIDRIYRIGLYKDRIRVFNEDALKLIQRYVSLQNTFIYMDPPYFIKGGSLYLNHYHDKDHAGLATLLNKHSDKKWVLTYDNMDYIKSLYPERYTQDFGLRYSAREKVLGSEVMIFSDPVAKKLGIRNRPLTGNALKYSSVTRPSRYQDSLGYSRSRPCLVFMENSISRIGSHQV